MTTHVAFVVPTKVNQFGVVIDQNDSIQDHLNSSTEMRIVLDNDIPNSASRPNIADYIDLEISSGYNLLHMSNTMIITSDASSPTSDAQITQVGYQQITVDASNISYFDPTIYKDATKAAVIVSGDIRYLLDRNNIPPLTSTYGMPWKNSYGNLVIPSNLSSFGMISATGSITADCIYYK